METYYPYYEDEPVKTSDCLYSVRQVLDILAKVKVYHINKPPYLRRPPPISYEKLLSWVDYEK